MTPQTIQIIGSIGALLILVGFVMNQTHKWKDTSLKYDLINFLGGILLVLYAYLFKSYPFLVLNFVWMVVSLKDVFNDIKTKK